MCLINIVNNKNIIDELKNASPQVFGRVAQRIQERIRILVDSLLKKIGFPKAPNKKESSVPLIVKQWFGYDGDDHFLELDGTNISSLSTFNKKCIWNLVDENGLVHSKEDATKLKEDLGIKLNGTMFSLVAYMVIRFQILIHRESKSSTLIPAKQLEKLRTGLHVKEFVTKENYIAAINLFSIILKGYIEGKGSRYAELDKKWLYRFAAHFKVVFRLAQNVEEVLKIQVPKDIESSEERAIGNNLQGEQDLQDALFNFE